MIRVWNSLSRRLELLKGRHDGILNWYACGPTVYDDAHLGHARCYVMTDVMQRIIERFGSQRVNAVMGITDVDDKIINRSIRENLPASKLSRNFERRFVEDMLALGIKMPQRLTRVTEHISEIIDCIQRILDRKLAYTSSDDSVYFDLEKFKQSHSYHKFGIGDNCSQSEEKMVAGKRHKNDFALWKGAKESDVSFCWDAPWGRGRPGWHIECTAMISANLPYIDVHSGGVDLCYPHHENEIAQAEAGGLETPWCPTFIHIGHLLVNGEKMSKSLGNSVFIRTFLEKHSPCLLRCLFLQAHYRETINLTEDRIEKAKRFLARWNRIKQCNSNLADRFSPDQIELNLTVENLFMRAEEHLTNDFDTPKFMLTVEKIFDLVEECHPLTDLNAVARIESLFGALGLNSSSHSSPVCWDEINGVRAELRRQGLFSLSDRLRQVMVQSGVHVKDGSL